MEEKNNEQNDQVSQNENKKEKKRYWIYILIFAFILFFATFGMTYSIYKPNNPNDSEIETGQIIFSYSDISDTGNGIILQNSAPISDSVGKIMVGRRQYFDFYITATTRSSKINYKLLINKDVSSTLDDSKVKLYLTQITGSFEKELVLEKASNLKTITIDNEKYYVIYEKILDENLEDYSDRFRLRMWVDEDAKDYYNQIYSIKVDVQASQVED